MTEMLELDDLAPLIANGTQALTEHLPYIIASLVELYAIETSLADRLNEIHAGERPPSRDGEALMRSASSEEAVRRPLELLGGRLERWDDQRRLDDPQWQATLAAWAVSQLDLDLEEPLVQEVLERLRTAAHGGAWPPGLGLQWITNDKVGLVDGHLDQEGHLQLVFSDPLLEERCRQGLERLAGGDNNLDSLLGAMFVVLHDHAFALDLLVNDVMCHLLEDDRQRAADFIVDFYSQLRMVMGHVQAPELAGLDTPAPAFDDAGGSPDVELG
jgi:hypothetical protein